MSIITTVISEELDRDIIPPKLKLCPFDGGGAELLSKGHVEFPFFVRCTLCDCQTAKFKIADVAVSVWNKRVRSCKAV